MKNTILWVHFFFLGLVSLVGAVIGLLYWAAAAGFIQAYRWQVELSKQ